MTASRKLKAPPAAPVRCAIYTRKSTEEGLDQDFTSLDAQREAAEAYIHSQAHAGWTCLPERYDDGGFSGSNLDRPALQRLLADIQAGQVDCVLCHRVDRLSRWFRPNLLSRQDVVNEACSLPLLEEARGRGLIGTRPSPLSGWLPHRAATNPHVGAGGEGGEAATAFFFPGLTVG
jgi:hypothetical protein